MAGTLGLTLDEDPLESRQAGSPPPALDTHHAGGCLGSIAQFGGFCA